MFSVLDVLLELLEWCAWPTSSVVLDPSDCWKQSGNHRRIRRDRVEYNVGKQLVVLNRLVQIFDSSILRIHIENRFEEIRFEAFLSATAKACQPLISLR